MSQQNNYVVFCPAYYKHPSLHEALNISDSLNKTAPEQLRVEENFRQTKGHVYFHELLVCLQA